MKRWNRLFDGTPAISDASLGLRAAGFAGNPARQIEILPSRLGRISVIDSCLTAILRLVSWLAFAGFKRRIIIDRTIVQHGAGHLFTYPVPSLEYLGDNDEDRQQSPLMLIEDGRSLGPAHSLHSDIVEGGCGRFSHYGVTLYFSSSDNTDPRINGRSYALSRTATILSFLAWLSGRLAARPWLPRPDLLRLIRRKAEQASFAARISLKWQDDKRHLPLTPDHWELYDIIHRFCWRELGEFPDLVNCRDYNDRIQWLKLFDQSEDQIRCSDKVRVRTYVQERIGEKYLVELFQTHDHFSSIDFDALPNAFVIKANNDSGTVIIVRDKSKLDRRAAEAQIESALKNHYGWRKGEWAYRYVRPKVLVEELLDAHKEHLPPDYKFYCSEGVVKVCRFISGRGESDTRDESLDAEGNDVGIRVNAHLKSGSDFEKPALWNEMIEVAQQLSRGHKFVRVDLFCTGNRVCVGEMTFWPGAGAYKLAGQVKLGNFLDFDRSTYRPPLTAAAKSVVGTENRLQEL
jgi:hypothetical protein